MEKIESLTDAQKAKFPVYVDKWIKIGTNTDPVNFEKAKEAICMAYEAVNLPRPTQFYVVDSPVAAIDFIKTLDPSKTEEEIFNEMSYGFTDATWLSFYDFFKEEVGVPLDKVTGLIELAKNCGWYNAYEDVVVFQHRPEVIKFDENDRLHCEDGPAIRFRDGFGVYSWHGVRIPSEWITDRSSLTPEKALTWPNVEERRCACEILGWVKILASLDYKLIDSDPDPMIGDLLEVNLPELGTERFLQVVCGTGRTFALPVPPTVNTALEANAWTYDIDPNMLRQLEVRT